MAEKIKINRAIISVSDKTGVEQLASQLQEMGVEIISTGGTLKALKDANVHAVSVSTFTGSPEILGGRVKTLHPKVHAGVLFRRDNPDDVEQMSQSDYRSIDLVVVNLYPFQQTLARPDANDTEIVENIDIGGPTLIRAAAKNFSSATVVVDPGDYARLIDEMKSGDGTTTLEFRHQCAAKAFALTSAYDTAIAGYFAHGKEKSEGDSADRVTLELNRHCSLRYGENPHQQASLYALNGFQAPSLIKAEVLGGKELSYNNYSDLDAGMNMLLDFDEPFACVLKHANPCGAATADNIA